MIVAYAAMTCCSRVEAKRAGGALLVHLTRSLGFVISFDTRSMLRSLPVLK